jgi:hypothetical protein
MKAPPVKHLPWWLRSYQDAHSTFGIPFLLQASSIAAAAASDWVQPAPSAFAAAGQWAAELFRWKEREHFLVASRYQPGLRLNLSLPELGPTGSLGC